MSRLLKIVMKVLERANKEVQAAHTVEKESLRNFKQIEKQLLEECEIFLKAWALKRLHSLKEEVQDDWLVWQWSRVELLLDTGFKVTTKYGSEISDVELKFLVPWIADPDLERLRFKMRVAKKLANKAKADREKINRAHLRITQLDRQLEPCEDLLAPLSDEALESMVIRMYQTE